MISLPKRAKKPLAVLGFVLLGSFLGLFLCEGAVRIFYPHARDHVVPAGLIGMDADLGWKLVPRMTRSHHSRYSHVFYSTNSLGFRDAPRTLAKGGHTYRVLLYGDSQIFGWGIPAEERFSNLMDGSRQGLEVWNLGVPGYGVDQEILSYKRDGASANADNVVFLVSASTLARIHTSYVFSKYKPVFEVGSDGELKLIPVPKGKNAAQGLLYRILSPMYLPYFIELEWAKFEASLGRQPQSRTLAIGDFEKKLLTLAEAIVREKHQVMTVLTDLPATSRKEIRKFCEQNGIRLIEIGLDNYPVEEITLGPDDAHWNVKANQLIAGQVLSQMERELPKSMGKDLKSSGCCFCSLCDV